MPGKIEKKIASEIKKKNCVLGRPHPFLHNSSFPRYFPRSVANMAVSLQGKGGYWVNIRRNLLEKMSNMTYFLSVFCFTRVYISVFCYFLLLYFLLTDCKKGVVKSINKKSHLPGEHGVAQSSMLHYRVVQVGKLLAGGKKKKKKPEQGQVQV